MGVLGLKRPSINQRLSARQRSQQRRLSRTMGPPRPSAGVASFRIHVVSVHCKEIFLLSCSPSSHDSRVTLTGMTWSIEESECVLAHGRGDVTLVAFSFKNVESYDGRSLMENGHCDCCSIVVSSFDTATTLHDSSINCIVRVSV
jgi:hypothetical protein